MFILSQNKASEARVITYCDFFPETASTVAGGAPLFRFCLRNKLERSEKPHHLWLWLLDSPKTLARKDHTENNSRSQRSRDFRSEINKINLKRFLVRVFAEKLITDVLIGHLNKACVYHVEHSPLIERSMQNFKLWTSEKKLI